MQVFDYRLEDALLEVVIRQKRLAVGRAYSEKAIFSKPMESLNIIKVLNESCGKNSAENVLTQEIMLHLGHLIRNEPTLFDGMITLRTWYFVQILVTQISRENSLAIGDAYEYLISLAPHDIYGRLRKTLLSFSLEVGQMKEQENLHASKAISFENISSIDEEMELTEADDWEQWRKDAGLISKFSTKFYKRVWYLLQQCNGLVIGDKYNLNNRIGKELTLDTTAGERNFDLRIDSLLQSIEYPEYRQLNIEVLETLSRLFSENLEIRIDEDLMLDVLVGHAVRIAWQKGHENENYDEQRGQAWNAFYKLSPKKTDEFFIEAFMYLLRSEEK
jgi:phosphorylase kinase alpha/beta subunit